MYLMERVQKCYLNACFLPERLFRIATQVVQCFGAPLHWHANIIDEHEINLRSKLDRAIIMS
jgi:hypothetical protein